MTMDQDETHATDDYVVGYDEGRRKALLEVHAILDTVLKHGHGGGNWRRLVMMAMERVETI